MSVSEAAANILGIATGVAGMTGLFNTGLECFDKIQHGRHFGKDFSVHDLKLAMLKLRLARWGEAVQLYHDPWLGRADATEDEIQKARDTLGEIYHLFEQSQKISDRYQHDNAAPSGYHTPVHASRPDLVLLKDTASSMAKNRQKGASLAQLATWSIRDKTRYEDLIAKSASFIEQLESLFPASDRVASLAVMDTKELVHRSKLGSREVELLKTIQEIAHETDYHVETAARREISSKEGHKFKKVVTEKTATALNGNVVLEGWMGCKELPSGPSMTFELVKTSDQAKVHNGDTFSGGRHPFFA